MRVKNLDEAKNWYVEKLNSRVVHEWPYADEQLAYIAPPNDDAFLVELLGGGDPLPIDARGYSDLGDSLRYAGYHHFCINVPDIEKAVADLRARGVKIIVQSVQTRRHRPQACLLRGPVRQFDRTRRDRPVSSERVEDLTFSHGALHGWQGPQKEMFTKERYRRSRRRQASARHLACDVRYGSKADICSAKSHVCFTPESLTLFDHLDRAGDARLPPVERTERKQKTKRLAERVLSQKAVPYMFESGTEAAKLGYDRRKSQTRPRATDAINLSQFARKIFLAPSSNRGFSQTLQNANFFGVLGVRYAQSVITNIPRYSIGYATIITISAPRSQATPWPTGQRALAPMTI